MRPVNRTFQLRPKAVNGVCVTTATDELLSPVVHLLMLVPCRDGKARRVESGTFPLANGIPYRMGLLRGYGNAIVPQLAAEFVKAFVEARY